MSGGACERPAPQYPIESVDRTLQVLTHLARHPQLKLSEVREHLGVGQSTAHRLMAMLVYRGFAVQDPGTRAYRPGPAMAEVGRARVDAFDAARIAGPVLEWVAERSGETVHLGTLVGTSIRYLHVIESQSTLRVTGRVGRIGPAHATSMGKAMLARYDDDRVRELYAGRELAPVTADTIVDVDRLLGELRRTRERGWARNRGEMESGVCSVGIGVELAGHAMVCGMSVATPQVRSTPEVEAAHAELLRHAVDRLVAAAS